MSDSDDDYTPEINGAPPPITEQSIEASEEKNEEKSSKEESSSEAEDSSDEFGKQNDEVLIVDDNQDNEYDPDDDKNISEVNKKIDVALFTNIVTYYLSSPLSSDPTFQSLPPPEKSSVLLQGYNNAHGTSIVQSQVNLNFAATTSYNKNKLRPRDEPQPLVPINPYCHRPDISKPMTEHEREQWKEFLSTEDEYNKEFNCMAFPSGSRLFVGNLAVNTLKQQDVWRVFRPYGKIVAVNMKQGFGFVQFTNSADCNEAIKGEIHVPLHNRSMELQVSKTHERHKEMKAEGLDPTKSQGKQQQQQQQQHQTGGDLEIKPFKADILILLTPSPSPSFNSLLVNTFQEAEIQCQIKHVDADADNIDQDVISQAAYGGKTGLIITRPEEVVDLMLFTKEESNASNTTTDVADNTGAIRFDNYESISMESAIGWISEHVKKQNDKIKATITSVPRQRDTRQNKQGRDRDRQRNNNYRDRSDKSGGSHYDSKERDRGPHRSSMESGSNYYNRNHRDRESGGGRNRRHNNDRYGAQYSESEQYSQKHRPVTTTGYNKPYGGYPQHHQQPPPPPPPANYGYQQPPPPPPGSYQGYQPLPPAPQPYYNGQPSAPQQYYNAQQQPYNPGYPMGSDAGAGANTNIYSQPPYGVQYPTQPGALPGMTTMPSPMVQTPNNAMGGLLSQLQGGSANANGNSNNNSSGPNTASNTGSGTQDDSTAALFETLARLKNNM